MEGVRTTRDRRTAGLALGLAAVTGILTLVGLGFAFAARHATLPENIGFPGYWSIVAIGSAASGLVLALRRPANPIGWLFLGGGLIWGVVQLADGYASWAVAGHGSTAVLARLAAGALDWIWIPAQASLALVFTLFPDGRFLSRRWRTWTLVAAAATLVATIANAAIDPLSVYVGVDNPLGVPWMGQVAGPALSALALLLFIGLANLVVRFRRSAGDERQQIEWLVPSTIVIALAYLVYVIGFAIPDRKPTGFAIGVVEALLLLALATIPIPIAIAVLKYRLYDIELVLRKTVVVTVVAFTLTALYLAVIAVATVGGVSRVAVGVVLLAVTFRPVRSAARSIADRVAYGKRASAYEVLSTFSERVSETYATDDVLPRMAEVLANATAAASARVWLRVGDELRPAADVGDMPPEGPLAIARDALPAGLTGAVTEVRHQGALLGALAVVMPSNDPLDPGRRKLVQDLAAQAGLVLRNVRLIEELKASRQRLVAAQDEERRRLERNIHDGAQQQLVALAVKQRLAFAFVGKDDARVRAILEELQEDTTAALEDLRDLARGIYPPLLADQGLVAALEAQARKAPIPVSVAGDGVGRFGQDVEAAVYFSCLEALQNIGKYAEASRADIALSNGAGELRFRVTDDGRGFDPAATDYGSGLQGIADRLAALGGSVHVTSAPGAGTTIDGAVPVPAGGAT